MIMMELWDNDTNKIYMPLTWDGSKQAASALEKKWLESWQVLKIATIDCPTMRFEK